MNGFETIAFRMEDRVDGVEMTPETIGFARFNRFNKEVEEFIKGGERDFPLNDIHVAIGPGSYKLKVILPLALAQLLQPDVQRLEAGNDLDGMNPSRQTIVKAWQRQARKNPEFKVIIESPEQRFPSVAISSGNDFHQKSEELWVETEKYLTGKVLDIGGKAAANVHLDIEGFRRPLVISSSEEYLRSWKENVLYHTIQVRVAAEQNLKTRELRNARLLGFEGKVAVYNEGELTRAIEKGTKAWADVENITQWVAEQRGDEYGA